MQDKSHIDAFSHANRVFNIDREVLGGTRVPIESLFDYLEGGDTLDEFLDDFPSVQREQAITVLEISKRLLTSRGLARIYEAISA